MEQRVRDKGPQDSLASVARHWGWVLFFGAVTLIAGVITVAWPEKTLVVVAVLFGIQLILNGINRLVEAFAAPSGMLLALLGIISIIVGLWAVRHAIITILSLTLFLGVYWVVHGLVIIFDAISQNRAGRGADIAAGALSAIAGLI